MNRDNIDIISDNGEPVKAQAPVIISASRSTDIPAFYSDWLMNRLEKGYLKWKNPFNGADIYVSFSKARLFVFWSNNPKPILKHLKTFDDKHINYYFQFTLNDYEKENFEQNVPHLNKRIETFIELSETIGKQKLIWRFDPLILTDTIGVSDLLERISNIGDKLYKYTDKLVISFADIKKYDKRRKNCSGIILIIRNGMTTK